MGEGRIYLRTHGGYVPMVETPYRAEEVLQEHLADLPDLLAGDQMTGADARRWLLVSREVGVPDAAGGHGRWALDHLFVDQDAIPTFVEVKRSTNTQIRREVVGQMLDYAANATAYWPPGRVRALVEERLGDAADAAIRRLVDPEGVGEASRTEEDGPDEVERFWLQVDENLARRRLRLVFAADEIPRELRSIIEYLNQNMHDTEVYGIEVRQYVGTAEGSVVETLVPRLIGQTVAAMEHKGRAAAGPIRRVRDVEAFLRLSEEVAGPDVRQVAEAIARWASELDLELSFGDTRYGPMHVVIRTAEGRQVKLLHINAQGYVTLNYYDLAKAPPLDAIEARLELNRRVNLAQGVEISEDYARRAAGSGFHHDVLLDFAARETFLAGIKWALAGIRRHDGDTSAANVDRSGP
jgi:hypothetical protein